MADALGLQWGSFSNNAFPYQSITKYTSGNDTGSVLLNTSLKGCSAALVTWTAIDATYVEDFRDAASATAIIPFNGINYAFYTVAPQTSNNTQDRVGVIKITSDTITYRSIKWNFFEISLIGVQ